MARACEGDELRPKAGKSSSEGLVAEVVLALPLEGERDVAGVWNALLDALVEGVAESDAETEVPLPLPLPPPPVAAGFPLTDVPPDTPDVAEDPEAGDVAGVAGVSVGLIGAVLAVLGAARRKRSANDSWGFPLAEAQAVVMVWTNERNTRQTQELG